MNKIRQVIKSLENDMPNIDVLKLVQEYYTEGVSVQSMANSFMVTPYEISKVLQALQLRRKRKHREEDSKMFFALLHDDIHDAGMNQLVDSCQEELVELRRQLQLKDNALVRARIEANRLRLDTRKTIKKDYIEDMLTEKFVENLDRLLVPTKITVRATPREDIPQSGLITVYSDPHYGEENKPEDVPTNVYNYEEAYERLNKTIDATLMYPRQSKDIVVVDLKDTLKGIIHGGLYTSEGSFIESITKAVEYNVYMYSLYAEVYDNVYVYSTGSNHDRVTENPTSVDKYLDYGRLIDNMVELVLEAKGLDNVHITTTDTGYNLFEVNGENIVAFHGDTLRRFKVHDGNQRALLQDICKQETGEYYTHSINGHGHNFMTSHNQYQGMSIQSGSMVGGSAHGTANGMRGITPSQCLCFVEPNGKIEDVKAVDLHRDS